MKVVHKFAEEGRIGVRHWRTEGRDQLKKLDGVSEDDVKHAEKDLQKVHDEYMAQDRRAHEGERARNHGSVTGPRPVRSDA